MKAPDQSQIDAEPNRCPGQLAGPPDDGLFRYVPVPPAYYDEDGYLIEDGAWQTDPHFTQTSYWRTALAWRLPTATVCTDLAMHYELGDTSKVLVPDLFVSLRVLPREGRECYKLWRKPVPELAAEMPMESTAKDLRSKQRTYEHIGVCEFWVFDPEGFEMPTPLTGYQLREGCYADAPATRPPHAPR